MGDWDCSLDALLTELHCPKAMAGFAPATLRVKGDNPLSVDPPEFLNLVSHHTDKAIVGDLDAPRVCDCS
jgi:hypothetical protein